MSQRIPCTLPAAPGPERALLPAPRARAPAAALASAFALAAGLAGCGPPHARTFAVVLDEPAAVDCIPSMPASPVDAVGFVTWWTGLPGRWRARHEAGLLGPAGGTLRVAPAEERGLAWLAGLERPAYRAWNGVVFEGAVHGDHLVVESAGPSGGALAGLGGECGGDPTRAPPDAELVATIDGTRLDGLLRVREELGFGASGSECAAFAVCSRDITVTGVEEP